MIKFENVQVFNLDGAIRGMRNSWGSHDKSDSAWMAPFDFLMGPNDLSLAMKLSKAGADHGKFLRQIIISVDVTAPEYWWKEADTYKVGTAANSTSMMHTLGREELNTTHFSFDDPKDEYVQAYLDLINSVREEWILSGKKKPSPEWRRMNQLMSIAYLYTRHYTANYQVLKNMYHSRKNHRLSEWHDLCDWVETLPYSQLITLKEVDET